MNQRGKRSVHRFTSKISLGLVLSILVVWIFSCSPTPTPHARVIFSIGGASAMQPVMAQVIAQYESANPYVHITLHQGNSATGLHELAEGIVDIALVSRDPRADELTHPKAHAVEIGRDGIVVVVHRTNGLTNVSRDQLAQIFSGQIINWSQLGGLSPETGSDSILVVSREEGSGTRAVFESTIMTGRLVTLTALIQSSEQDVLAFVAANPNSIGYAAADVWMNRPSVHALMIDSVAPSLAAMLSGRYPLMRPFYFVVPDLAPAYVEDFVRFVVSPDGQKVVSAAIAPPR